MNKNDKSNVITETYNDLSDYMMKNNLSTIAILEESKDGNYVVGTEDTNYDLNLYTL